MLIRCLNNEFTNNIDNYQYFVCDLFTLKPDHSLIIDQIKQLRYSTFFIVRFYNRRHN